MTDIEFASFDRTLSAALESCAAWAQAPLEDVIAARREGRWGEYIEQRKHMRRPTGREALREIDSRRHAPWDKQPSPAERIGELRAMRFAWRVEELEALRRPRDPFEALAYLRAHQVPDWWVG